MPRAKPRKATMAQVKAKQSNRSRRARAIDASSTAKTTYSQGNRDGLGRWVKNPRRSDVSGVDTKGSGRAGVKLYPKPAKARTTARKKSTGWNVSDAQKERVLSEMMAQRKYRNRRH